ncbi:hypothetical protein G3I59_46820 [Amycolatopsis rubida]|uniref:Uncharacterized protein n=1 Tax=Amycolatopsis rubida TaxID=112413 RepID=A0ABX0C9A7_9PSEU|nr:MULTISPECIES: hypothetical protein [Amycolatopsis]MYW97928.1 hypothetical protein [Amycolatopsis rubida]NEC62913.1 hypothetical protein [Amycolatopsis rubida]
MVPVVAATSTAVMTLLALVEVGSNADRIEVIKTGLAMGAGTGGVVASVLNGRRAERVEHALEQARLVVSAIEYPTFSEELSFKNQLGMDLAALRAVDWRRDLFQGCASSAETVPRDQHLIDGR